MPQTVGVVIKPNIPEALVAFQSLQKHFPKHHYLIEKSGHTAPQAPLPNTESVSPEEFEQRAEMIVVLGGDGTLIHAASLVQKRLIPLLGIHMGRIGFLTEVLRDELISLFPQALNNQLPFSDRMRLEAQVFVNNQLVLKKYVLNDAVLGLQQLARVGDYKIKIGEELVSNIRGDGVIVSTPTGSTAYAMAAGGSILSPELEAIAITPICPHQLTQRPIIVPPHQEVCITLDSDSAAFATLDGQTGHALKRGDCIVLKKAPLPTRILYVPGRTYFAMLRTKLHWGG